jgi:predicted TPR repeat methyltransferase
VVTSEAGALLQQALQLHQQGKLDAAQDLYRQVLARVPRQFDALHLLGVIARQRGDAHQSAALIREALQVDANQARAHCNLGAALQDLGEPQAALQSYETALGLDPHYALAWDNRGNTLRRLGRLPEALDSYERALGLRPDHVDAWCHRAIVLHDLGRFDEAAASAERALQRRPTWPDALLALGNALQGLERFKEAVSAYDQALAWSQRADVWCARGAALKKSGALTDALDSYEHALALRPDYALAQHYRANVLRALNRKEEALAAYRQALDLGADATEIGFALAALGEGDKPAAAPPGYVKGLFDQYAGHFDQHLVDVLAYRTPALLEALLRPHLAGPVDAALDLGCGTGLCGPLLRPLARHLTGVDLSQRMLDKASAPGVYDELACAEIVAYLEAAAQRWDLVLAADVFVYFGDLAPVFGQVRQVLREGGLFAFSVETLDTGEAWAITPSNRFAHALDYVQHVAAAAGFTLVATKDATLRREHGQDVAGHLVLLRADA